VNCTTLYNCTTSGCFKGTCNPATGVCACPFGYYGTGCYNCEAFSFPFLFFSVLFFTSDNLFFLSFLTFSYYLALNCTTLGMNQTISVCSSCLSSCGAVFGQALTSNSTSCCQNIYSSSCCSTNGCPNDGSIVQVFNLQSCGASTCNLPSLSCTSGNCSLATLGNCVPTSPNSCSALSVGSCSTLPYCSVAQYCGPTANSTSVQCPSSGGDIASMQASCLSAPGCTWIESCSPSCNTNVASTCIALPGCTLATSQSCVMKGLIYLLLLSSLSLLIQTTTTTYRMHRRQLFGLFIFLGVLLLQSFAAVRG